MEGILLAKRRTNRELMNVFHAMAALVSIAWKFGMHDAGGVRMGVVTLRVRMDVSTI